MNPKQAAAALMLLAWIFLALAFLTSCVAVPVPPFGDRVGEAGTLHIRTTIQFEPRMPQLEREAVGLVHALDQFKLSTRTLNEKR